MAIIRRMDMDGDARVNKEEFDDAMEPKLPYSKSHYRWQQKYQQKLDQNGFALGMAHGMRANPNENSNSRSRMNLGKLVVGS